MEDNKNYNKALSLVREGKFLEAKKYYEKAIKEDYDCARYDLGLMYFRGDGVKRDIQKAMKLWSECTWDYRGDYALGLQYYKGEVVPRNLKKAYSHWNSAASHYCDEALINCAIMLFSGKAPMRSEDEAYDFSINRNFYYLTGLEAEDMVLLITNVDGISHEYLFLLPYNETLAKWVGGRILPEKAKEISEIKDVRDISEVDDVISSLLDRTRKDNTFKFYFDMWHYNMDQESTPAINYANKLKARYPYLIVKDIFPVLTSMRLVKDEYEIANIRKAGVNNTRTSVFSSFQYVIAAYVPSMHNIFSII